MARNRSPSAESIESMLRVSIEAPRTKENEEKYFDLFI